MRRATADEARELTGFTHRRHPAVRPQAARSGRSWTPTSARFDVVWAAAGTPNAVFPLAPATLRMLSNAVVTPIAAGPPPPHTEQAAGASPGA